MSNFLKIALKERCAMCGKRELTEHIKVLYADGSMWHAKCYFSIHPIKKASDNNTKK